MYSHWPEGLIDPLAKSMGLIMICCLLCCHPAGQAAHRGLTYVHGGITRGPMDQPQLALVFTGDEFADGAPYLRKVLADRQTPASFFLTGNFYRNPEFEVLIEGLIQEGHYLGAHSDQHLLYCSWEDRDSLLVSREEFTRDLDDNYQELHRFGIDKEAAPYFLPPYEWYNEDISRWTSEYGLSLINYSPGTLSHADYATPSMAAYRSSEVIFDSILSFEVRAPEGLNGFILLSHIGVSPEREDKFYHHIDALIDTLTTRGYEFVSLAQLLET
ncbi:MAG: polysaccharide deacetylase family protein [Bacteroidota bacterium]